MSGRIPIFMTELEDILLQIGKQGDLPIALEFIYMLTDTSFEIITFSTPKL